MISFSLWSEFTLTTFSTYGLPSLTVPVLSITNTSIASISTSAAAFLINTPDFAPFPTPTMTDIGAARPRAQGQALIRTAISFTNAYTSEGSAPSLAPQAEVAREIRTTIRKHGRDPYTETVSQDA